MMLYIIIYVKLVIEVNTIKFIPVMFVVQL